MEYILKLIRHEQDRLRKIPVNNLEVGLYEVCRALLVLAETVARAAAAVWSHTPEPAAAPAAEPAAPAKKPYTPPVLTEYGSIGKLTQNGMASVRSDHGNNSMHE
jgi:hypothetical protein